MTTYEVLALDLDSSFRDRTQYPNPGQFLAYISQTPVQNAFNASDPIVGGVPFETALTSAASLNDNQIILSASSSSVDNYYINKVIQWNGQFATVVGYVGATKTATVSPPFSAAPGSGQAYSVSYQAPIYTSAVAAGSTTSKIVFATVPVFYGQFTGSYLYMTSGVDAGELALIQSFDPTTSTAVIGPSLTLTPGVGDTFEVLAFTRDNFSPIRVNGSVTGVTNPIAYEIKLCSLSLPLSLLYTSNGGNILDYPYVYVELKPKSLPNQNSLFSNNPAATWALFKVLIDTDSMNANYATMTTCSNLTQFINFKLTDQFLFSVYLPDGNLIQFQDDSFSPFYPNPLLQISATFLLQFPYKENKMKIGR